MNNQLFRGLFALFFLCLISVSLTTTASAADWQIVTFGEVTDAESEITSMTAYQAIELWHYSGDYWANTVYGITIPDSLNFNNPDKLAEELAEALNKEVTFEFEIPDEVQAAAAKGSNIIISCEAAYSTMDVEKMFYLDGSMGDTEFYISGDTLYFKSYPKLNFYSGLTYKNYVDGLTKYIPLAETAYGKNRYSIFTKGGTSLGAADGYFNSSNPTAVGASGTIHPSQITSSSGALQSGLQILVYANDTNEEAWYDSDDVNIGSGTFQDAGAVAIQFWYPLKITFYVGSGTESDESGNDIAVTSISSSDIFEASVSSSAAVTVKNNSAASITTPVTFTANGSTQSQTVTLAAGETQNLSYTFTSPASGSFTLTAVANASRTIEETDYTNNTCTKTATIFSPTITDDGDSITWTELDEDVIYTYKAVLASTATVSPSSLKSGYGFAVSVNAKVTVTLIDMDGDGEADSSRTPDYTITAPTSAVVTLPWTVTTRLGTQGNTVTLSRSSSSSTAAVFETPANSISAKSSKLIYTDVALSGTSSSPQAHSFTITVSGGGVKGKSFSQTLTKSITINGDMYEDDVTGAS